MKRALFITLNEIRLYLQDKGDLAFGLLLPVVTFALMYGAFGGHTLFEATARIVNEDRGAYSTQLIEQLDAVEGIDIELLTAADADARLERSDLLLVLYIPAGFSDELVSGGKAELIFKQRGNGGQEGQILASIIRGVAGEMNQEFQVHNQVISNLRGTGIPEDRIDITVQRLLGQELEQPVVGVVEEVVGGSPDFINLYLPGIVTMYVLFALTINARAIVEERKRGTLERLLTTRLSVGELFFGKFMASVTRGFVQTLILLCLSYAVFQLFTPLSFLAALVICLIFAAAASALGMIIASIARSEDGAVWIAVVFTMIMVMLGGTFFQVSEGSILETIGKFSISTYANDALRTVVAEGGSLGDTVWKLVVLAGICVVGLGISRLIFKVIPGGK
ncbi:MAG TPA: ABC transporter permease [Dehalococcoidales bacterium]|nr:ABC transporter permease [Dehalococcoidales bacterium]